jgi:glycerol-3-phosphate dehydrogenase
MTTDFDLIVIGAGINGAGVARDAAMRGLNVLLLDKGDFGGATSSWSTRLIHGGLRYLEHGEFSLVRESLRERDVLLRIAPHLVKPLQIMVPVYANRTRGLWTIRAGMIAYDLLSFDKKLPAHLAISTREALKKEPGLDPTDLRGAVIYYDAQVEFAERLVLENVLSAVENKGTACSYSRVTDLLTKDGRIHVKFTNVLSGASSEASGWLIVNASGPWVDSVLAQSNVFSKRLIGGTKGSHVIVDPFPGAPETAIYVEAEQDNRPIFIIPWNGRYLIGTTDIRYSGELDHLEIDDSEINYLIDEANRLIPAARLTRESILFSYAGVRPLAFTADKDEQGITRKHFIHEHTAFPGLISLVGGKLTTYRRLAEETVDLCLRRLGKAARECTTASTPLPGARTQHSDRSHRIYGRRAEKVFDLIRDNPELAVIFDPETGAVAAEIVFAFQSEFAQTLTDCLIRRTMVGYNSTCGLNAIEAAADIARKHLGWSEERARKEIESYRSYVKRFRPRASETQRLPN